MTSMMTALDIMALERATVAAVSPQALEEIAGWLLPFDTGTVGRARSAAPLAHGTPDAAVIAQVESRYAAHGIPVTWRLPELAAFDEFAQRLRDRGYQAGKPTHVQTAAVAEVIAVSQGPFAQTATRPDAGWASSRVATLSRAPGALFASIREGGETVAAGMGGFSHGWASVHGMRTAQHCRSRGLAGRVLTTLARAARERGIERMFLQVEAHNAAALALYKRAGFTTAWTYSYWKKP